MGVVLCMGLGSFDFILEVIRMVGIFFWGFGFFSMFLVVVVEVIVKGSVGSRVGVGFWFVRCLLLVEEKKEEIFELGSLE